MLVKRVLQGHINAYMGLESLKCVLYLDGSKCKKSTPCC